MRSAYATIVVLAWIATATSAVAIDLSYIDSKIAEGSPTAALFDTDLSGQKGVDCAGGEIYDDNDPNGGIGVGGKNGGFVQLFTPTFLPYRYESFCVCLHSAGVATTTISEANVVFYDDDGPDGGPGTLLGSVTRSISGLNNVGSCDFFHLNLNDEAP